MARKGQVITNKITGETITWLATSKDTAGEFLGLELLVQPKGLAAVSHIHPDQDEHFKIKKGSIKMQIGDEMRMLYSGQTIVVPKGTPHQWWNPSDRDLLVMDVTFTPALRTEVFFEQFFGLCNDGRNNADGSFRFWQMMASLNVFNIYTAALPVGLQKFLGNMLGPVARLMGYRTVDLKYSPA